MRKIVLRGTVTSGQGLGGQFITIPWAKQQIEEKLGFRPYRGTLNLELPRGLAEQTRRTLQKSTSIRITPAPGYFPARCFKASIMDTIDGAIIIPQSPTYPPSLLEVIAAVSLRQALALTDGDEVEITIVLDST